VISHLSTLKLHQLRSGELDADQARDARAHLDACATCAQRLRHQERVRAEFVLRPMPPAFAAPSRPSASWWRWAVPLLAAAAALGLLVVPPSSDGIRTRGRAPALELWVATDSAPRLLLEGESLGAGDRVGIKFDPAGATHVAFAGRDHRDVVEVFGVIAVDPARATGLQNAPFGLELDDAPGEQEFFLVASDRPLDEGLVKRAVRSGVPGVRVERMAVAKQEQGR